MVNHFWQSVDAILEDASVIETTVWCSTIDLKTIIFQCSKNYSSPTRVTMQYSCIKHGRPSLLKRKTDSSLLRLKSPLKSGPCSSCLSSFVSLWVECRFHFELYSFLYIQIISLLFINMQISEREAGQQATACHYPPFKSCRYWTPHSVCWPIYDTVDYWSQTSQPDIQPAGRVPITFVIVRKYINIEKALLKGCSPGYSLFSLRLIGSAIIGATFNLVARVGLL